MAEVIHIDSKTYIIKSILLWDIYTQIVFVQLGFATPVNKVKIIRQNISFIFRDIIKGNFFFGHVRQVLIPRPPLVQQKPGNNRHHTINVLVIFLYASISQNGLKRTI